MDPDNLLLDLKHRLEDAAELLAEAENKACELLGDDPERGDPGWPLMAHVIDQADALQRLVFGLLHHPELVASFKHARDNLDHLSDQADAASY